MLDEVGFGQFNIFVGGVMAPAIDRLASHGSRHNGFHTTPLCSPIAPRDVRNVCRYFGAQGAYAGSRNFAEELCDVCAL